MWGKVPEPGAVWCIIRGTVPASCAFSFLYSMSDERVKAVRNLTVQTQRVNHVAQDTDSEVVRLWFSVDGVVRSFKLSTARKRRFLAAFTRSSDIERLGETRDWQAPHSVYRQSR